MYNNSKYVDLNFYIFDLLLNNIEIIVYFKREIYVIKNLQINILIKINIFNFEQIIIDINKKTINFLLYREIISSINIIIKKKQIFCIVKNVVQLIIFVYFCIFVFIKIKNENLFLNKNYLFYAKQKFKNLKSKNNFFNHITNVNFVVIQIRNIINQLYILFKNVKIDLFL